MLTVAYNIDMRLLYWGSDYYSTIPLKKILACEKISVVGVVTGRNKSSMPFPYQSVEELAKECHIPIFAAEKKQELLQQIKAIRETSPDIGLVASFGLIIPKELFESPKYKTLNLHPSKLPLYRGPSPVPQSILDGQQETAITIMEIVQKMDAGNIIDQLTTPIEPNDTTLSLLTRLFELGTERFIQLMTQYPNGTFPSTPQDEAQATFTKFYDQNSARINWEHDPAYIFRQIRAFYPKPIAWTTLGELADYCELNLQNEEKRNLRIKIHQAMIQDQMLHPISVQIEGKTAAPWKQISQGYLH